MRSRSHKDEPRKILLNIQKQQIEEQNEYMTKRLEEKWRDTRERRQSKEFY